LFQLFQINNSNYWKKVKRPNGLTMIEVLIVVTIIGILSALIVPKLMKRPDQARVVAAKQDISSLSQALYLYKLDNYFFPSTNQGLESLIKEPTIDPIPSNWMGPYINNIQKDPWGGKYYYSLKEGQEFEIFSFGADQTSGGKGVNEDISSKGI
jgi:general secretion pathway protein G